MDKVVEYLLSATSEPQVIMVEETYQTQRKSFITPPIYQSMQRLSSRLFYPPFLCVRCNVDGVPPPSLPPHRPPPHLNRQNWASYHKTYSSDKNEGPSWTVESGEDEINDGDECGAERGANEVVLRGASGSDWTQLKGSGLKAGGYKYMHLRRR